MKKILFLLSVLFLIGCYSNPNTETTNYEVYIEEFTYNDSTIDEMDVDLVMLEDIKDSMLEENSISDTTKKESKRFITTELDTTSVLQSLKNNKEIINQQQILLDSLLKEKKKN